MNDHFKDYGGVPAPRMTPEEFDKLDKAQRVNRLRNRRKVNSEVPETTGTDNKKTKHTEKNRHYRVEPVIERRFNIDPNLERPVKDCIEVFLDPVDLETMGLNPESADKAFRSPNWILTEYWNKAIKEFNYVETFEPESIQLPNGNFVIKNLFENIDKDPKDWIKKLSNLEEQTTNPISPTLEYLYRKLLSIIPDITEGEFYTIVWLNLKPTVVSNFADLDEHNRGRLEEVPKSDVKSQPLDELQNYLTGLYNSNNSRFVPQTRLGRLKGAVRNRLRRN